MTTLRSIARNVLSLGIASLAGCATIGHGTAAANPATQRGQAAAAAPDMSGGLRCMDELLQDYGTRDLTVIAEDLADPSRKFSSAKDLLIAAVSDISRRSRAIRVVAAGAEAGGASSAFQALKPQYVLRGSVRRVDDNTLGVDLTVATTQDGTIVPGVGSRRQLGGASADQTLQALVEGATIELFGRMAKVPYWTCLGQADNDPAVAREIRDWYDAMVARPKEIIEYFQAQLRLRGAYAGPIDGAVNPQFNDAVARYRQALGLSREPKLSKDFMQAYLGARHSEVQARVAPAEPVTTKSVSAATAPATQPMPAAPLALRVGTVNDARQFERDEIIRLSIKPNRDAHVYCFLQDENGQVSRFFPNRFQRDSRVDAGTGLQLPGAMRFEIRMNGKGRKETVACFATERDVLPALPPALAARDFAPLPMGSLDELRQAFSQVAAGAYAHESFEVRPR
jgi:hypothetical protein